MRPRRTISRLWSLAGIGLLLALWEAGHRAYGPIVLPGLDDTLVALLAMLRDGTVGPALAETVREHLDAEGLVGTDGSAIESTAEPSRLSSAVSEAETEGSEQ